MLYNRGDGTFGAPVSFDIGALPDDVAIDDLDGDGLLDVIVVNEGDSTLGILYGVCQ